MKWLRRTLILLALLLFSGAATYVFHGPLLTALANTWIVNDPLERADAIIVLGGGLDSRPFAAAELYHKNYATNILFMNVRLPPAAELGITPSECDTTRQILLKQQVPESACQAIGNDVTTTYDESVAVRKWVEAHHAKRVIIPTDLFHTRRVRWLFGKQLKSTGASVIVRALNTRDYAATNWWCHEQGVLALQNEAAKLAYYWLKY